MNNINGIDVSECDYFEKQHIEDMYESDDCNVCIDNFCALCWKECEEYNGCYFKRLKHLQKENEELKARLKTLDDEVLMIEITPDEFEKFKKYKQALEKIRNIAEKLITELPEYHSCYYKDECSDNCTPKKQSKVEFCCYENVDKTLAIIDEVLNDRD